MLDNDSENMYKLHWIVQLIEPKFTEKKFPSEKHLGLFPVNAWEYPIYIAQSTSLNWQSWEFTPLDLFTDECTKHYLLTPDLINMSCFHNTYGEVIRPYNVADLLMIAERIHVAGFLD